MKKLIVLILIMSASFTLQAQQLKGTQEYSNPIEFGGSKYSIINWTVNYQILFEQDRYYIRLSYPKVSVSPSSLYGTPNKFYSKSDLGISTWPHTDPTPYNFSLELTLIYPDGSYHKTSVAINENSFIESNSKFKNAGVSSFKVASVEKMNYNGAHDQKLDELIAAKKNGVSKASKNTSNSEPSNNSPLTQTGTTNTSNLTENTTAKPLDNYDPNTGLYTNPMANNTNSGSSALDSFNKGQAQGQQIADVATGIADLFAPSPEQLRRREADRKAYADKEISQKLAAEKEKEERFVSFYVEKYWDKANSGDEDAQMILYYASHNLQTTEIYEALREIREKWFNEAVANNNLDAMVEKAGAFKRVVPDDVRIYYLERAASLGNLDAMLVLAELYNRSSKVGWNNPEKAIKWYTEAAEKGSPNAMFHLGMIYKYGRAQSEDNKNFYISYNIPIDEKRAFEYFSKSIQPEYEVSIYHRNEIYYGSYFNKNSYVELSDFYKKGKFVKKDMIKAKELKNLYLSYQDPAKDFR